MGKYAEVKLHENGFTYYVIRDEESNQYFAGYSFMGDAEWEDSIDNALKIVTDSETMDFIYDLELADAPAKPVNPADKEYLLKTVCDGIRQTSIKTGKQIADIYDFDQEVGIYNSIEVYDLDTLKQIDLEKLVNPILENKRWMEQEYRDYCENVREYGLDFEGR